jgi:predicted amidohydrolase
MHAVALSFGNSSFTSRQGYLAYVESSLAAVAGKGDLLLVFPAYLGILLALRWGELGNVTDFKGLITAFIRLPAAWHEECLQLHRKVARRLSAYLVPGTFLQTESEQTYHQAFLLAPDGRILGSQRQVYLSRLEKAMGLCRGEELNVFQTATGTIGIIIGTDAWYSEVGRILALQGAEIICHCGALPAGENRWLQRAGMWQQVQQNQFFCVESQLAANIGEPFSAESLIHAPCEMTENFEGILARGGLEKQPVAAVLNQKARRLVIDGYPLLQLMNPLAYADCCKGGRGNES